MRLYHGTDTTSAQNIVGPPSNIDVTVGCGELGRGFYMAHSVAIAISWAVGRHGMGHTRVIAADIDEGAYSRLSIRVLNHSAVLNTWQQLRYNNLECRWLFGVDVVYGPLATISHEVQHKFESSIAQGLLNSQQTKLRVL